MSTNKKAAIPKKAGEKKAAPAFGISKWYQADDQKTHFRRKRLAPRPTRLRRGIAPGQVLILLSGRFRGKRVVFLKQLKSGLLLVTGPFKVNGVPLKRVNQVYVVPTKTRVDLNGVKADALDDSLFVRPKTKRVRKSEEAFFATSPADKSEAEKKRDEERKQKKRAAQADVDKALLANIKKVELLKKYLASRFTITNNFRPHEAVF
jgi:large subunit ribosomal protein L6e